MPSSVMRRNQAADHHARSMSRRIRRRTLLWLFIPFLSVAAVSVILYARTQGSVATTGKPAHGAQVPMHTHSTSIQPADRFIQSIVTGDGALGWHQLCPNIQARLPLDVLVQQANAVRATAAREGVWPSVEAVGTHAQPGGGEFHIYRLTAHWPNGATQQLIYSVLTQPSGCVEDVQVT